MMPYEVRIGLRVKSLRGFVGVPMGTEGVIDEEYDTGVMVAWDLPGSPLPPGYQRHDGSPSIRTGILRDGFDKRTELEYLQAIFPLKP